MSAQMSQILYDRLGRVAPVIEIPAAAHHIMLDQPVALIAALRTLLSDWDHPPPPFPLTNSRDAGPPTPPRHSGIKPTPRLRNSPQPRPAPLPRIKPTPRLRQLPSSPNRRRVGADRAPVGAFVPAPHPMTLLAPGPARPNHHESQEPGPAIASGGGTSGSGMEEDPWPGPSRVAVVRPVSRADLPGRVKRRKIVAA